jgi:transcriptional regulator with XRE-family HTH domain
MEIDEATLYMWIGERLRARRDELGMKQGELADAVGVKRSSISNIESGRQKAPLHLLYRLSAILGIDIAAILPPVDDIARPGTVPITIDGIVRRVPPKTAESIARLREAPLDGDGG